MAEQRPNTDANSLINNAARTAKSSADLVADRLLTGFGVNQKMRDGFNGFMTGVAQSLQGKNPPGESKPLTLNRVADVFGINDGMKAGAEMILDGVLDAVGIKHRSPRPSLKLDSNQMSPSNPSGQVKSSQQQITQ